MFIFFKKTKTRFAPSPTGLLHVGGLRTALYNYLFAKKNNGEFILRIEDTDQERLVAGASEHIENVLKTFGLNWDNEEIIFQSKRLNVYQELAEKLIKHKKAYYCFCDQGRLDDLRKSQQEKKISPKYDRNCLNLTAKIINSKIKDETPHVVRFKMPQDGQTKFTDLVRGEVSFDNKTLDDQIIIKSDGFPTYHLASVVDDHDSKITHVIRGEEWLPSTPKHILLYDALSWEKPKFAHLPLLLNPDKSKLSKRQGDVNAEDFLKQGYLAEALLNFILLLGWNPGTDQEIFNIEEMINIFDIKKINKAGAIFNTQKLDWLNSEYIKKMAPQDLASAAKPFFDQAGKEINLELLTKIVVTEQERIKKLSELPEITQFFFSLPDYNEQDLVWKKSTPQETKNYLKNLSNFIKRIDDTKWDYLSLESEVKNHIQKNGWEMGDTLWPFRFALSGQKASPSPFEIAEALGKEETLKRLDFAIKKLEK